MDINKSEFPVVVQAFDLNDNVEIFIAEQVVSSQAEADTFTARYAGKLIKARPITSPEQSSQTVMHKKTKSTAAPIWLFVLLVIIVLIIIGFTTGWIQENLGIEI